MSRSNAIKGFGFALWLLAVSAVLATLYYQDTFLAIQDTPIARLENLKGEASARSEGNVQWSEIGKSQKLFDGDLVAIGQSSRGTVAFDRDRKLIIYSDTQVKILRIQSSGENTYMITLIRGNLEVDNCDGCPEFIVKSGDNQFRLSGGKSFGLSKEAGKKAKKVKPKEILVKESEEAEIQPTGLDEEFLKDPPKISAARGLEPQLSDLGRRGQKIRKNLWTMRPLGSLSNVALEVPVSSARRRPENGKLSLLARLEGASPKGSVEYMGRGAGKQHFKIPFSDIKKTAKQVRRRGGLMEYVFAVRAGALVRFEKDRRKSFGRSKHIYSIKTYGEYPGGPVSIGLGNWNKSRGKGVWMKPKSMISPNAAPIAIHLASSKDLSKFNPYFRGASTAGRSRRGLHSQSGIFVVRRSQVIAQLRGKGLTSRIRRDILTLLGGEFIFKGPRSALHDARSRSKGELVNWMSALLDKGTVLHVLKRKKLYPVSRRFIKSNEEVGQFIDEQANAVFLDKVEILESR